MKKKIIIGIIVAVAVIILIIIGFGIYFTKGGCTKDAKLCPDGSGVGRIGWKCEFAPCPKINSLLSEAEARAIAEKSCIKGGEVLSVGIYNENSKTWWYRANLNATREGCNPACVVSEKTKTAEINWRCTGLKQ